jgi:3-methyladenine DNA glycosylase/8-oxoguanine DNA glycosylase
MAARILSLRPNTKIVLEPRPPYNFDANFHKPSHFPSSDTSWEKGKCWTTMVWHGEKIGLRFENRGTISRPRVVLTVYSRKFLSKEFIQSFIPEVRWRFNFDQDISEFCREYRNDKYLRPAIKRWRGMKPIAANSLYETLMIYLVLQNATVRRSVQMLENLFDRFGAKARFDDKVLSVFWKPSDMARATEKELRELKVGYRAKFFTKITEQFVKQVIDEFALRKMTKEQVKVEMMKLYGIGPASVEYLLFEDFYFLDAMEKISPWEQKIMSRLLFSSKLIPADRILNVLRRRYRGYEKLAFHYIWENLFWRRKHEHIDWLEKEIRL